MLTVVKRAHDSLAYGWSGVCLTNEVRVPVAIRFMFNVFHRQLISLPYCTYELRNEDGHAFRVMHLAKHDVESRSTRYVLCQSTSYAL